MLLRTTIDEELAWCAGALESPVTRAHRRVWIYDAPQIVLGCSQRAHFDLVAARAGASASVRVRRSGGGAVLVGPWMVGVSVILPTGHRLLGNGLIAGYRWLGELFVRVLHEAAIDARALDPARDFPPVRGRAADAVDAQPRWACFGSLSPWEVVDARWRKLVGLAQQRRRTGVLVTAGLLASRPDWKLLCDAFGTPDDVESLQARTAACDEMPGSEPRDTTGWASAIDSALGALLEASETRSR